MLNGFFASKTTPRQEINSTFRVVLQKRVCEAIDRRSDFHNPSTSLNFFTSSSNMEFDLVIKVKYADTLRRFNVHVKERDMDLDIPRLREKILNSFKLSPDANLTLTYVDEDNDVVTLVDDDDLRDAALIQRLNPLRINVSENSGYVPSDTRSLSGKSTPVRSPHVQTQFSSIGMGVEEALKAVSGPLHDALFKLTDDLASKVTSPASLLNELVGCVSKLELAPVSPVSQAQGGSTHASIPTPVSHGIVDLNAPVAQEPSVDSATMPKVVPNTTDAVNQISVKCSKDNAKMSRGVASSSIACNDLSLDIVKDGVPFVWPFEENVELQKACCGVETKATVNDLVNLTPYPSHTSSELLIQQGEKNKQPLDGVGPSAPPVGFSPQGNEVNSEIGGSNYWAVPPRKLTRFGHHQFKRSFGHRDSMFRTFHRGVQCDACGMSPIVGPRFKSKLRENFDLCNICFSEMGNEAEFSRIDNGIYRPPGFLKNINKPHLLRFQVPPVHIHGPGLRSCKPKLESRFIQDVTVLDETSMAPSTPFTKIWRMRNSGTVAWPPATMIVWIGGDRMGNGSSVELEIPANGCPVNEELDIAVEFTAPSKPGRYISYWKMATPWGQKFGQRVWVLIQVDADQKDTSPDTLHLNLNLPPVNSSSEQKKNGVIDVNIEPFENEPFENVPAVTGHSNMALEQVKPLGLQHPNDQIDFQNVGNKASASASYPIIDLSELLTVSPAEVTPQPSKPTNPVEESLLKELEEMGFKQFDLNQEVLRRNNYNMENSLDDLCDMAEWDPILEDLQEMGFCDREMNKKLLIKNGGSIKRVVLDLIAGEKE